MREILFQLLTWRFLKSYGRLLCVPGRTFVVTLSLYCSHHQTGPLGSMQVWYRENAPVSCFDHSATFSCSHAWRVTCINRRVLRIAEEVSQILRLKRALLVVMATSLGERVTPTISLSLMALPKSLGQCCTRRLCLEIFFLIGEADVVEAFDRGWVYTVHGIHNLFHSVVFALHFWLIKLLQMF